MKKRSVEDLKQIAKDLRKKVVTMIYEAQSGHPGGSLSAAEFVTACYFYEMNVDPKNPKWEDRDRPFRSVERTRLPDSISRARYARIFSGRSFAHAPSRRFAASRASEYALPRH